MFAVIRHYHFNPEEGAEIDRRISEEFAPIIKNAKEKTRVLFEGCDCFTIYGSCWSVCCSFEINCLAAAVRSLCGKRFRNSRASARAR